MLLVLQWAGNFQEVNDHDLVVIYCLRKKITITLPFLVINHMIKTTKPIKSTSNVPYGMLMTLIFRHFGVYMEDEPFFFIINHMIKATKPIKFIKPRYDDVFSWGANDVAALRLNPQPRMETTCTCSNEEDAQNKEKKKEREKGEEVEIFTPSH